MKKIIITVLTLALILSVCVFLAGAAENGSLSITDAEGKQGDTVTVAVSLNSNPGLITMKLTVNYPSDLELINAEDCGLLGGWTTPAPTIRSPYTIRWADSLATTNNTASGEILILTFKIKDSATEEEKTVTVDFLESRSVDGNRVIFGNVSSKIKVHSKTKTHTVEFKNEDGTLLSSNDYHWGDKVTAPAEPTKAADDIYTYTFAGWDKEVVNCTGDATYTATYKSWQFADVSTSSWQINAVVYACNRGLMAGKGTDGNGKIKFDPNSPISREEFAQVLYNAENKPSVSIANKFPDVANNGWYKNAVLWANQAGIASGMGDGRFGVGKNITRQDLAMMLYKYAKLKGCSLEAEEGKIYQFADGNKVADYAKTAMDWAVTNGILSGKGDAGKPLSTFRLDPTGTATRAECAAMLKNFMEAFGL